MPILEDGQLFERYRVHRWLGGGVAGESYEAEDRILQRKVTLKVIHPWTTLADSARRQFFREMQGISLLNHPYLATVLDYGEIDGRIYVARRYVSSGSLLGSNGRLWFHPPLPAQDAFKYAHQLAQALQYIHQHGYVHGSLTFANILVLRGPDAENTSDYAPFLLADVGLAHFVRRFGHPRLETLPVSAAPEQLTKRVTPASDQFALAVLLYFWLAGRPPYLGASSEIEQQKQSEIITPLSMLNPGITLEQDAIMMRALTAYPENRYPSALNFAETLLASLTSAIRLYAVPLSPLTSQPETPRDLLRVPEDVSIDLTETTIQAAPVEHSQPTTAATPPEEVAEPVQPLQFQAELYHSALEELLARPYAAPESSVPAEESNHMSIEGEIEPVQAEEHAPFPALPETPFGEEDILQLDFVQIISPEETNISRDSEYIDPFQPEPLAGAYSDQPGELMEEVSTSQPDNTYADSPAETGFTWATIPIMSQVELFPDNTESTFAPTEYEDAGALEEDTITALPPIASMAPSEYIIPDALEQDTVASFSSVEPAAPSEYVVPDDLEEDTAAFSPTAQFMTLSEYAVPDALEEDSFIPLLEGRFSSKRATPTSPLETPADSSEEDTIIPLLEGRFSSKRATPTGPLETPADSSEEDTVIPLLSKLLSSSKRATPTGPLETPADSNEEDTVIPLLENQLSSKRATPTIPLEEFAAASAESETIYSLAESTLTSAEIPPTLVQSEIFLAIEGTEAELAEEESLETAPTVPLPKLSALPEESPPTFTLDQATSSPQPEMEQSFQNHLQFQEVLIPGSRDYPLLEQTNAAPRLIISSPYVSSSFEFLLIDEEINIGRAGVSDLYLEQDNLTSRHHALLKRLGERMLIFDKHSHNGVFINGQKIDAGRGYELADGDHIGIGNYELIYRSAPASHISQLI